MNAQDFESLLVDLGACLEARKWAKGKTLKEVWETCERVGWMLWLVGKMADKKGWPTHKEVVAAACDCAETALKYLPKGEDRPRKCIETVRAWIAGDASLEDVRTARVAALNAAYAAYAADAADAAYAAYAAADAAYAAYAADAAYAAADAAYAAPNQAKRELADLFRKNLKVPTGVQA